MEVSLNGETLKWLANNGNPINMDDFGIHFRKPPHWVPLAKHGSVWVEARHQDGYH